MADSDVLINLTTAIYTLFLTDNEFKTSVNGQLFENDAYDDAVYPYAVYSIIAAPKLKTFGEEFTNALIQLSLFSSNMDSTEIKNIYFQQRELFNDCLLTVTGSTHHWMTEENLITDEFDEETTLGGTRKVKVYHVDYDVLTELN